MSVIIPALRQEQQHNPRHQADCHRDKDERGLRERGADARNDKPDADHANANPRHRAVRRFIRFAHLVTMIPGDDLIHFLLFPDGQVQFQEDETQQDKHNADRNEPDGIVHILNIYNHK